MPPPTWPSGTTTSRPAPAQSNGSDGSNGSTGPNGVGRNRSPVVAPPTSATRRPAAAGPDANADDRESVQRGSSFRRGSTRAADASRRDPDDETNRLHRPVADHVDGVVGYRRHRPGRARVHRVQ